MNYGAKCPACGADRSTGSSASLDPEGHRIRHRRCLNCTETFTTVEIAVPWSFSKLDDLKHEYRNAKHPPRYSKDCLVVMAEGDTVTIKRIPGKRSNLCRKGLHTLFGDNVYVNPRTGQRVCQPCRRESARARYHHMMKNLPPALREERNARNREYLRKNREKRRAYQREWARRKRQEQAA